MNILTVEIESCPPGVNQTYGIKGNRGKGQKGLFKTDEATAWQEKAALVIGSAAAMQDWKDESKYYSLEIVFHHPRLDVDAPVKLIIDTVAQKLGFNDSRIMQQTSRKVVDEKESVTIILRGADQLKLSFSKVDTYATCPELWRQVYLLKNKLPWSLDASYGVIVHNALKVCWEKDYQGACESIEKDNWEYFENVDQKKIIAQKLVKEGIKSLNEVVPLSSTVYGLSPELHIDYPDFQGYFDLLINDCIVDWKIVNGFYNEHKLLTSEQLVCYAWLHYRKFGYLPKKVAYINLNKWTGEAKVLSRVVTLEEIQYWEKKVEAIRSLMEKEIYYKEPRGCYPAKEVKCHFYEQCWNDKEIKITDSMLKFG